MTAPRFSHIAEALRWATEHTERVPVVSGIARRTERAIAALTHPHVRHRIGDFVLLLPLEHKLPFCRRNHPLYDSALGRLAALVHRWRPGSCVVDVGANVGDTAAVVRTASPAPLLLIEGDTRYFELLKANSALFGEHVTLVNTLVSGSSSVLPGRMVRERGTAHLVCSHDARTALVALEDVLATHCPQRALGLVKLDTDGFDCLIVEGSMPLWKRTHPILFIEYDPAFYPSWDPLPMWRSLVQVGYRSAVALRNTGEFEGRIRLEDERALKDLHVRYSGCASTQYADLVLFPSDATDLASEFAQGEVRSLAAHRAFSLPPSWEAKA